LGVFLCPEDAERQIVGGSTSTKQMQSGHAWTGFRYARWPSLPYGFAAITPDIDALDKSFQALFRNVLSLLKVNMNIRTFYRITPKHYQGLGMPNPLITMLSQKLHLLQTQFNQPTATGRMLQQSLEVFQMEVGISSNILEEDFIRLGNLATDGWWKRLWKICHGF
jgi:hypothetical protein